ncbi:hypothetical protein MMC29_003083 [Sticta canariensis]|nr:hypothetical protein [Sticta canariensis]
MGIFLAALTLGLGLGLGLGLKKRDGDIGVDTIVDLGYSKYRGKAFADGTSHWLGMRYAAAPVGQLRFAAPQDPERTTTIQAADKHGPRCLPTLSDIADKPISPDLSEDCLYVDVYAPADTTNTSNLPVYVFIQGGGFNENANANYDGKDLVKVSRMGIVVVNFNYRVGPYGFLASLEVKANASLNNGLKDQRQLFHWIQSHISEFGGNPSHVVMGGASAGAASVTLQLIAYGGRDDGLFHATAAESQSFGALRTVSESQYQYNELVARTNCTLKYTGKKDTLSCLRALDIEVLQKFNVDTKFPNAKILPLFAYNPTLDYDFIQDYTLKMFEDGHFVHVPAIYGDTTDEGTIFVPRKISTLEESREFIQGQYPVIKPYHLNVLSDLYPPSQQFPGAGEYWHSTSEAYGELRYVCPGIHLSNLYSRYNVKRVYNYRYNVAEPGNVKSGIGVPHVAELNAIWSHQDHSTVTDPGSDFNADIPLLMQMYWVSFIMTFDPNSYRQAGSPRWEGWTANGQGSGMMSRLVVQDGVNATTMEKVQAGQQRRCDAIIPWCVNIKQ